MGRLFFVAVLSLLSVASLAQPWIGVLAAYLIAILTPQAIWYWNFEDLRPALWVILPTLLGFGIRLLSRDYDLATLRSRRNLFLLILWLCFNLSYLAGPYADVEGPYRFSDPAWAASTLNKVFLVYFVGCVCLNDEKKLKALVGVIVISAVYLIYWANERYLSGQVFGRLQGPTDLYGMGIYADENNFAMLFVVALPFLWYAGHAFKNRAWRWGLWLIIPFGWHAIFLTASRGGLIGIAVTLVLIALRSKHRRLGLLLIPAFVGAYLWQAGDLMRERAGTIEEFRTESSAASRLDAWSAALNMIAEHPLTGVGLASFGPAFPDHSDKQPREAHNTLLQITAESGVIAGVMYVLIVLSSILALWRNGNRLRREGVSGSDNHVYLINEATLVSFCGLVACSLFLSLQMFEVFYFLCLMTNVILFVGREAAPQRVPRARLQPPMKRRVIAGNGNQPPLKARG